MEKSMKAMVLKKTSDLTENRSPLEPVDLPVPVPTEHEILIKVSVCGVCHTELDEIEGRTPPTKLPIIPGHQIVGRVVQGGSRTDMFKIGARVGVAWIHSACGKCIFCASGQENLCEKFKATGRDADGGYAEYAAVPEAFAYEIPQVFSDAEAARSSVRRGHRLSFAPSGRYEGRRQYRAYGIRRIRPSRAEDGPISLSTIKGLCLLPHGRRAAIRQRARRCLVGRRWGGIAGEASRRHRHNSRLEARGRGDEEPCRGAGGL